MSPISEDSDEPSRRKESEEVEEKKKIVMNEIECWIDLLMKILLRDGNTEDFSDLIGRVLEESGKSLYMRKIATTKVLSMVT